MLTVVHDVKLLSCIESNCSYRRQLIVSLTLMSASILLLDWKTFKSILSRMFFLLPDRMLSPPRPLHVTLVFTLMLLMYVDSRGSSLDKSSLVDDKSIVRGSLHTGHAAIGFKAVGDATEPTQSRLRILLLLCHSTILLRQTFVTVAITWSCTWPTLIGTVCWINMIQYTIPAEVMTTRWTAVLLFVDDVFANAAHAILAFGHILSVTSVKGSYN